MSNNTRSVAKAPLTVAERANSDLISRVPPYSMDAEQSVLAGVLLDSEMFLKVADVVKPGDFYVPAHQIIFSAYTELSSRGAPINVVSVAEYLQSIKQLEAVGGSVYLSELSEIVVGGANAEYYAGIVRDKSIQRTLINTCSNIISNCYDTSRRVDMLLDESEQSIFSISERTSTKTFQDSKTLAQKAFDIITNRMNNKNAVTGVTTGFDNLNELTSGLQPSDLVIVAARPSMGKTAFALNMAMRAATLSKVPVAIFSLEMSSEQLMMRLLCAWGKIDLSNVRKGKLSPDDLSRLYAASDAISKAPIYIDDTPALSSLELRSRTRRLMSDHGVGLVVIDYLQLMRASKRTDSREQEISDISRSLKALAKEMNIPVMALSQLNRKLEERGDKRPMLSDLRESGAIEQDADLIMFIYRDEVYNKKEGNPNKGKAEIIIGKQRNGPVGSVELSFISEYTAFEPLERHILPSEEM